MPLVTGVTFRRVGKVYYFDPGELALREGDFVIAETARGIEFGEVVLEPRDVSVEELVAPLKKIVRVASNEDLQREAANREKERNAMEVCERKVVEHNLQMKMLDAECSFDGSMITFSFSAEGRIDFRELVRDLANTLHIRVQLHQIGVRDEAKLIGGYGTCGRTLCCATFLSTFEPVSMKMAKDQSLFLNPSKFSGACGKLMCCLRYEHEYYKSMQHRLPSPGAVLEIEQGKVRVLEVNVISGVLTVETEEGVQLHVPSNRIKMEGLCRRHGVACECGEKGCERLLPGNAEAVGEIPDEPEDESYESGNGGSRSSASDHSVISRPAGRPADSRRRERPGGGITFRDPKAKDNVPGGSQASTPAPPPSSAAEKKEPGQPPRRENGRPNSRKGRRPGPGKRGRGRRPDAPTSEE
jgi:cell fate regulator YaaT (PSP1 superfamily)